MEMRVIIFFWICLFYHNQNTLAYKIPKWSNEYSVEGVLYIPYAEIEEPFTGWYQTEQSRIDYYNGMVKTYQLSKNGNYGTLIKIAPVTTEDEENVKTCLQINGTKTTQIRPQTLLPALDSFQYEGTDTIDGEEVQVWRSEQVIGDKYNKYTMWLTYGSSEEYEDQITPIRYEMKGYNTLLGSHYDHYYLEYHSYKTNPISEDIFALPRKMSCNGFPGPGEHHISTFNPIAEFIKPESNEHVLFEFDKFQMKHKKRYENRREGIIRLNNFRQNLRYINSINRRTLGYTLAVNHLADWSSLELEALRGRKSSGVTNGNGGLAFPQKDFILANKLPISFDWRIYGAVTPVKDQSVCGSCWSFGTVGAVEGAFFLANGGHLMRLSQQALIDCSWGYGNNGCDGGEDFRAYKWIMKHGGLPTEENYGPYLGQDGLCHIENVSKVAPIRGFVNVTRNSLKDLQYAVVYKGPISVAIDAAHKSFVFYSHGVYYEPKCGNRESDLDHAVLVVGYGSIFDQHYWLVKNSWSTYWGNDGYVLMSSTNNNCGVMSAPTYVVF